MGEVVTPVAYYVPSEFSSPRFAYAFAKGCKGSITDENELFPGPVAMFGSPARWPLLKQAQAEGREWLYGDHGYFGRSRYYRITKNAYQHDGTGQYSPERYARFGRPPAPWRKTGSYVLVCPNSAIYCGLHGFEVQQWIADVTVALAKYTDRPVKVRWKKDGTRIADDLEQCWAVVVFSSAAAIDALIAGVPAFVLAPFAAGARMALSDLSKIEQPFYPEDREPFLWSLANQQWTLQEMIDGVAWRALQEVERRAA